MALETYNRKRNFKETSEPIGSKSTRDDRRFVVQEHHASHLHWDLRLEMAGVLKSWAVPKGPPLEPHVRRLAIMTEDHPVDYLTFQGIIPKGSYGAGSMTVWDTGTYDLVDIDSPERSIDSNRAVDAGKLSIVFHGARLDGFWEMVRTDQEKNEWLLFMGNADRLDESRHRPRLLPRPAAAKAAPMPVSVTPMLAVATTAAFSDPDWIYEVKWDGYRAVCFIDGDKMRLVSRNQLVYNDNFPELTGIPDYVRAKSAIIDGEIVAVDQSGAPRFQQLQNRAGIRSKRGHDAVPSTLIYYAFDLLYADGYDTTGAPLIDRKAMLRSLLREGGPIRYADHVVGEGEAFFEQVRNSGLEGMVAKRSSSTYVQRRSDNWRKIKAVRTADVIICGYTEPTGSRSHFGALLVGLYSGDRLIGVGRVGSGYDQKELDRVFALLQPSARKDSPLANEMPHTKSAHWVTPDLVCEVKFTELTDDRVMRHPTYLGLREDKSPRECTMAAAQLEDNPMPPPTNPESDSPKGVLYSPSGGPGWGSYPSAPRGWSARSAESAVAEVPGGSVPLTHLNKVYWPALGKTKGDLIAYYQSVSDVMLPYLRHRPLILQRYPNGVDSAAFFQHDLQAVPSYAHTFTIGARAHSDQHIVVDNVASLLYVANLGTIPIHALAVTEKSGDLPDWIVFDLDPEEGVEWTTICDLATALHDILAAAGLESWPKTSGSEGMHVFVPIKPSYSYPQVQRFALLVAGVARDRLPGLVTLERMTRKRRRGEIYLDCLQNGAGKGIVAPYSVRATPHATVSMPLTWDDVKGAVDPASFNMDTVPPIAADGDRWAGMLERRQEIPAELLAKSGGADAKR